MDKKIYNVHFKFAEGVWCVNLAIADNAEQVAEHYAKYGDCCDVLIDEGNEYDLRLAERKGMPITRL